MNDIVSPEGLGVVGVLLGITIFTIRYFMDRVRRKDERIDELVDTFTETVNHKQSEMTTALERLHESITYLTNIWKNGK